MSVIKSITKSEFRERIFEKVDDRYLKWGIYMMVVSFFYNLPVMTYSAMGNNELRLYDFAGGVLMFHYFKNFAILNTYIRSVKTFSALYDFLMYALFTVFFTALAAILANKVIWVIQTLLYFYHFYVFFLSSVFLSIFIHKTQFLKRITNLALVSASVAFFVVILQNFGVLPYLWSDAYNTGYVGFLSGTFGPNKIVLGISTFLMLGLCLGLLNEKRVNINKLLVVVAAGLSILVLIMSGSRTAYVGVGVLLGYYSLREPLGFAYSSIAMFFVIAGITTVQPEIIEKAVAVYQQRVESKVKNPEDLQEAKVDKLYDNLGAGRKQLSIRYIEMIADEFYYIPFGRGFNNRLETMSSAHNMYLSLIYEVGLVGMVLYVRWLVLYLFIRMKHFTRMKFAMQAIVIASMITLFFGEHLYVYRAHFAMMGLFIFVMTILSSPIFLIENEE